MFDQLRPWLVLAAFVLLAGCATTRDRVAMPVITEDWLGQPSPGEIDSVATWRSAEGKTLLFATAKQANFLRVYDGDSGRFLRVVGQHGTGRGDFSRPNGIFVIDDHAFIVERDNHRIQIVNLEDMTFIGEFGSDNLRAPYGLWVWPQSAGAYRVYVTDSYYTPEAKVPPNEELGERVKMFEVRIAEGRIEARHRVSFGATSGPGVLKTVESVFGDPVHGRLLVADEDVRSRDIKVYSLDGEFTGRVIGQGVFAAEPEGIARVDCSDEEGYWVVSDQHETSQVFRLFDRRSLEPVGAFMPAQLRMVDGIWFEPGSRQPPVDGVLYSQHDDTAVAALRWSTIAGALGLNVDCGR